MGAEDRFRILVKAAADLTDITVAMVVPAIATLHLLATQQLRRNVRILLLSSSVPVFGQERSRRAQHDNGRNSVE